jgi:hypothetical protein
MFYYRVAADQKNQSKCSFCACVYSILYMRGEQATQANGDRFNEVRSKQSLYLQDHILYSTEAKILQHRVMLLFDNHLL